MDSSDLLCLGLMISFFVLGGGFLLGCFYIMDKLGYEIKGFLGDKTIWGKKDQ